jgi:hypothetical protein
MGKPAQMVQLRNDSIEMIGILALLATLYVKNSPGVKYRENVVFSAKNSTKRKRVYPNHRQLGGRWTASFTATDTLACASC